MTQTNISPRQAYDWLSSGDAILIDVREPDEFKAEHIAYALSLPLAHIGDSLAQIHLPPTKKLIFQCLRGKRGEKACSLFNGAPSPCAAYNIEGGIEEWKKEGLPVVGSSNLKIPIFRQIQVIVGALVFIFTMLGLSGHGWGFITAGALGGALTFAGITGWCGMAMLLAKMPWNKP